MVSPRTKFVSDLASAKAFLVRGYTISFHWESATPVVSYLPRPFQSGLYGGPFEAVQTR